MSKNKSTTQVSNTLKPNTKVINRKRKAAFERKCLSKAAKRLFAGSSGVVFRLIDKVEKKSREKIKKGDTNVKG